MNARIFAAAAVGLAILLGIWFGRDSEPVARAARAVGLSSPGATPGAAASLRAAGVHKCLAAAGTSYVDGPCAHGSREVAADGGTLTVVSFPKPAPAPSAIASSVFGGAVVKPMDPDERDRLRDKAIEDAANRR